MLATWSIWCASTTSAASPAYWEIPASEETAINGHWVPGPGMELFRAMREALGELPLIAEDLGVITPDVEALRDGLGLPGMARPAVRLRRRRPATRIPAAQLHRANLVVYTGTHDNNTMRGWWDNAPSA